jgi:hypothetical protein
MHTPAGLLVDTSLIIREKIANHPSFAPRAFHLGDSVTFPIFIQSWPREALGPPLAYRSITCPPNAQCVCANASPRAMAR